MAKTRSQTRNITIKKEEEEDCKSTLLLNGVSNTRNSNRITKRRRSKRNSRNLPVQQVKVEEDADTKSLLQASSTSSNLPKGQQVSQEQIDQLINAIVNENMSVTKASCKANLSYNTGLNYYNVYKNDPDKKIPSPQNRFVCLHRVYTQEHIENLITYIKKDKMSVAKASAKVNMSYESGRKYYKRYLKDPNHAIPIPYSHQRYTQDQNNEFIGYIINDKMSITAAARKAKLCANIGSYYYRKYFKHQNTSIPKPSHIATRESYTQEQIKEAISYIVDDKMSIKAASRKVNIGQVSAGKHYRQYLKSHNMEIPAVKPKRRYTQEQITEVISYIVDDKMTIAAASRKANMCRVSARYHYRQYLKDHNMEIPVSKKGYRYTRDEIKQLIGYIVDDKMTIKAASKKADMQAITGTKHYRRYLNDIKRDSST